MRTFNNVTQRLPRIRFCQPCGNFQNVSSLCWIYILPFFLHKFICYKKLTNLNHFFYLQQKSNKPTSKMKKKMKNEKNWTKQQFWILITIVFSWTNEWKTLGSMIFEDHQRFSKGDRSRQKRAFLAMLRVVASILKISQIGSPGTWSELAWNTAISICSRYRNYTANTPTFAGNQPSSRRVSHNAKALGSQKIWDLIRRKCLVPFYRTHLSPRIFLLVRVPDGSLPELRTIAWMTKKNTLFTALLPQLCPIKITLFKKRKTKRTANWENVCFTALLPQFFFMQN